MTATSPGGSEVEGQAVGSGRVAIVTGAARGIGAAVARRLAADGWKLVLVDACADDPAVGYRLSTPGDLASVRAVCLEAGAGGVETSEVDVRDLDGLRGAVGFARERFDGLDAAIAVAGVMGGGSPAWETSDELWGAMLGVNLGGVWNLVRAAVPEILRRPAPRGGRVVAVSSTGGVLGLPKLAAYVASKHAVVGLMRSLAAELGGEGVTANVVAPGSTRTEMLTESAAIYGLSSPDEFAVHHLEPRLLEPSEIADAVAWLCSPGASGVTGAVLPVDAGMTAR